MIFLQMTYTMSFLMKKERGQLMFCDLGGYETRNPSTMWCIQQADVIYNWNDFPEMKIDTGDAENTIRDYTYSKQNNYNRLVPDFNFHSWPQVGIDDYDEMIRQIDYAGLRSPNTMKLGWIGNINTNIMRKKLFDIGNNHKNLFDIFDCGNWWKDSNNSVKLKSNKYISLPDLVNNYGLLIDIEGNGYSGRLKHLLWSHRPVLLVDRPHKEYFFEYLKEWEHYIPVKRDLSDLVEKTNWCLDNYEDALKIAENAYKFSKKYLTRNACYEQWDKIIKQNR